MNNTTVIEGNAPEIFGEEAVNLALQIPGAIAHHLVKSKIPHSPGMNSMEMLGYCNSLMNIIIEAIAQDVINQRGKEQENA